MTIQLFVGQEFDHTHEMTALRKLLEDLVEKFGAIEKPYFVLVNYLVGDSEIDVTVLKTDAIIVLELKECGGNPVRGSENGDWVIHGPDGVRTVMNPGRENPYRQARRYRFAWMDLLNKQHRDFISENKASQLDFSHVSAFVVLSPRLHPASDMDIRPAPWFKVVGLDRLSAALHDQRSRALAFTKDELSKLAESVLHLRRVDVQDFLRVGLEQPSRPPSVSQPAPHVVITHDNWKAYCRSLVEEHHKWTEMLLPPEALVCAPARLIAAQRDERFRFERPYNAIGFLEAAPLPVDDCVRKCRGPLVILGSPGAGKTFALEILALEHARKVVEKKEGLVPVFVKLNRYKQDNRDLLALVSMSLQSRGLTVQNQAVDQLLANPSVPLLLLFDGLDEVQASEWLALKHEIESFPIRYPACQVVITCRTSEYQNFGLRLEGVETVELVPFDENIVRAFLVDYYWASEQDPGKGRLVFDQLEQQSLLDLAQTPLHLGLIVGLVSQNERLPANKGQLYHEFVARVLRLEAEKGKAPPSQSMQMERFLAHLALAMQEQELRRISRRAAGQAIGQHWQEMWESGTCSLRRDQLFDLVWNSRLLVRTDGDAAFRHAVLQDYFAARRLEYMIEEGEGDLYRYVGDPSWEDAFALLAGMQDDASQLVEVISRRASPLLTLKCLGNASTIDEFVRSMAVERLLDQLFDPDTLARHFTGLFAEAPGVLKSAEELRDCLVPVWIGRLLSAEPLSEEMILLAGVYLGPAAELNLISALEDADTEDNRDRSALLLGYLGSKMCVEPLMSCIYDENPDLRYHAIESLGRRGAQEAISALRTPLSDADPNVRQMTITVLGALCGADVSPLPESFIEGIMPLKSGKQVDGAVVKEVKEWLRPALSDLSEAVQTEAAIVLGCLGEVEVTDRLVWLLGDTYFDYHQKARVIRALGSIGTAKACDAVQLFHAELPEVAPLADQQHIRDWDSPISFEIAAALSYGNSGPLLHIVARWRGEGFSISVEEARDQGLSILGYRVDRLTFYREKLVPEIVGRGIEALDDLFECINAANDGLYAQGVEAEANYLLQKVSGSAKFEELIDFLGAATHDIAERTAWERRGVEHAVYLVGQQSGGMLVTGQDPLLRSMKEDDQLAELFIHVHKQSGWAEVRQITARALAHYVRLVGRDALLGSRAYEEMVEPWLEEWEGEDERGRHMRGVILSLCGDAQAVFFLLPSLEDRDVHIRFQAAVLLLEHHCDNRAVPTLIELLRDPDATLRTAAAVALGKVQDPRATAALVELVRDPDDLVRWAAVQALEISGDESVVEPLIHALSDEDPYLREEAIEALSRIGGERADAGLARTVIYDDDRRIRSIALEKLIAPSEQALEAVRRALRDEDPMVRSAASSRLSSWAKDESDVENLRRIYAVMKEDDGGRWHRVFLLNKLWTSGTREAVKAIEDVLQDPHEMVRLGAIQILGLVGSVQAVPALRRVVEEDAGAFNDRPLADEARKAIEEIQRRNSESGEQE